MKVVILCGGYGTRIRGVSDELPKPMIPIGDKPIIWHIMKYYSSFGHDEFILCLGYKSDVIKDYFLNYETRTTDFSITLGSSKSINILNNLNEKNWKITFAETGLDSMTGTRIKIQKYIDKDESFMLTYGDGLSNINIDKLISYHKSHGKSLTLSGVKPAGRFGEIMSDSKGAITEFKEKPETTSGRINGGFFVANYSLFNFIDDNRDDIIFEKDPMNNLVRKGELMQFDHDGFWQPMDTMREYEMLNKMYKKYSRLESMVTNEELNKFYKNKTILLTGSTGFKGSWLAFWLYKLGAKVVDYSLDPLNNDDHFNLLNLKRKITYIRGNILDNDKLKTVFEKYKPEIVFHLAAQALVRLSYDYPKTTFDTNVAGSVNILEAVKNTKSVKSFIYVTSDKAYKNKEWIWGYKENDELGGHDPYSASKAAAEIVFSSYNDSFFDKIESIGVGSLELATSLEVTGH